MPARRWRLTGRVQGVGFRPFVYRLAQRCQLTGWVQNRVGEVAVHAQGSTSQLHDFESALIAEAPPLARPEIRSSADVEPESLDAFTILPSVADAPAHIHVPPDYFTCDDCLRELRDPADRRYRYPFINCTQCGPRYTLITRLPYDRPNTTMGCFPLCAQCRAEYENPLNRRFHAEPVACPACGPSLHFIASDASISGISQDQSRTNQGLPRKSLIYSLRSWVTQVTHPVGAVLRSAIAVRSTAPTPADVNTVIDQGCPGDSEVAVTATIAALRDGRIVAVKGVGGYHLMCDARNADAVARLRVRKPRPHKPLAVMYPWRGDDGLDALRVDAQPGVAQAALLRDPVRPIVLVPQRADSTLAHNIAPGLNEIGVFLPYSPLHHLLLDDFDAPLVATSANLSGEPVLTEGHEVEARLAFVAEAYLHHDRPIARPADDPVYREIAGRLRPLRLGRGNAPLEIDLPFALTTPTLAVGGHMKNTVTLAWDNRAVVSPHIGDLDAPRSIAVFEQVIADLQNLYGVRAGRVVCDAHPGYASTRWARQCGLPLRTVFHHHAHAAALAAEHADVARWLMFTWDGVGYGVDGTLWGGEALLGAPGDWARVASFRTFHLPGGNKAGREPWRSAAALCWETGTAWGDDDPERALLHQAWRKRLNAPASSAVGRLFDAAASLLGLIENASFEGQGPMLLEAACNSTADAVPLPLQRDANGVWRSDWSVLLPLLMDAGQDVATCAARFHASLARALCDQACQLRDTHGAFHVGLCGGVFQNRVLTELASTALTQASFDVRLAERLPVNDAGISFGQIVEAVAKSRSG